MAERSTSRLRQAGNHVASRGPPPGCREEPGYGERGLPTHGGGGGPEGSRQQVQSALDGLLNDNEGLRDTPTSYDYRPAVEDAATMNRSPEPTRARRSSLRPDPILLGGTDGTRRGPSSSGLLSPGGLQSPGSPTGGGYTPTSGAGRSRRRSSVRSPKSSGVGTFQGVEISTLEGLQVFLDGKQKEVVNAHARRTTELETVLTKEENYFNALLDDELEKTGAKLQATSSLLKGQNSTSGALFRRGSRRLSEEGITAAMQTKHGEEIKKADHLRKKLKAHHDEARLAFTKKLQVETSRMGRIIKKNLGAYANPNLAQSAKAAVLASIMEYLNGEEFVRIVTAPLAYKSPDFVMSTEQDLGVMGVEYSPTNARNSFSSGAPTADYDTKMAQLQGKKLRDQQQRMAEDALRRKEAIERESKAAMEQETAEAYQRADEEIFRRQEDMRRQQEAELEEQKRQLDKSQDRLRREAEVARARHKEELERHRADMVKDHEALLERQAETKRMQEAQLARQREEMQRQHEEEMDRQREAVRKHAEEVAAHKEELVRHELEARREQEALEDMRRRAKEEEDDERRRLEAEVAKHKEEMRLEAEAVKKELETLRKERESIARKDAMDRAAAEAIRLKTEAEAAAAAAETLKAERQRLAREEAEAAARAQTKAELDDRPASDTQVEGVSAASRVAGVATNTSEATMGDLEESNKRAAGDKLTPEYSGAESATTAQGTGGFLCTVDPSANVSGGSIAGPGPDGYREGDAVEALCTPVGAPSGVKQYIKGEVAHRNPDGSVDVILTDGRMRPDVPLSELKFIDRPTRGERHVRSADAHFVQGVNPAPESGVTAMALRDAEGKRREDSWKATKENGDTAVYSGDGSKVAGEGTGDRAARCRKSTLDDILGIKLATKKQVGANAFLEKGDVVKALGTSAVGDSDAFSVGVIRHRHEDDFYDIELEDGKMVTRLRRSDVLLVRKEQLRPRPTSNIDVGDRVEARYGGDPNYYPGVVSSVQDGISVNFHAGWHGASIPHNFVRMEKDLVGQALKRGDKDNAAGLTTGQRLRSTGCILELDVGSLGGDTPNIGDQVQVREEMAPRAGSPVTYNGVIRSVHPNGTCLVGLGDGSARDQVPMASIMSFEWTSHASAVYRVAAMSNKPTPERVASNVSLPTASNNNGAPLGGLDGTRKELLRDGNVGVNAPPRKESLGATLRSAISAIFGTGRIVPLDALGQTVGADAGGHPQLQRRMTHAGVVESGERSLSLNVAHFRPQEFMDPDTAAAQILTPNNAGMFKSRAPGHRPMVFSELSYNTTSDDSDTEGGKDDKNAVHKAPPNKKASIERPISHNLPSRRMTFGGLRSDKAGDVYNTYRRPSLLASLGKKVVKVAKVATKTARRLSIGGNGGQGFELVAIADRNKNADNKKGVFNGSQEESEGNSEHETHFYNRLRHVFEPQNTEIAPSSWWIRVCGVVNLICMAFYLHWRFTRSLIGVNHIIWAYVFLGAECVMAIGMIVGHSSRSFPVHREKVYMDDLTDTDEAIGKVKIAVLVPTCGEKTSVMLKALFGNLQLRLWKSTNPRRETLRIVVLDEKRREEVQTMVSLVYTLAEVVLDKTVREILMREGVAPISAKGFYEHFADGEHGQRIYDDINFIRGVEVVSEIDKLVAANDDSINRFSPSLAISRIKERARRASCFDRKEIAPGQKKVWNRSKYIPTIVYYSRIDAGQPRISPKAGNMNRAIFSFNPQEEPLIGEASIIVINDVRHELYPEFLQRTVPYFFTFDRKRRCYKWADIAFVQTPQRFHDVAEWNDPDPLGNQAATQFDIVNSGRDGVGGALSCGQGSVWRVQVLRDGIRPDGTKFIKKGSPEDQIGKQGGLGFRSEVLIEDTHTSIDLFRQGWKSVYVNFPKEVLARCTFPPNTVKWRWKQVLRWHQGAVQLAMWKGWKYSIVGEHWAAYFQKVFAFDALSYFLQAFAGEVLLVFPIVYGFTNSAPFNTWNIEFALYFFPFIITGVLPTVAALGWQNTSSTRVMRDEQIWFATSFVQIYAVMHAVWGTLTRKDPSNAWECKCPVWPLYVHFLATIVAITFNTWGWAARSFEEPWVWVSCIGAGLFSLHSLWPVVSFGLGVTMPPAFYTRVFGMLVVMTLVSMWLLGEGGGQ